MLRDSQGRNLWIMGELGGHAPVRSFADILGRQRGRGRPDWWVVAKSPHWTPPGRPEGPQSLLSLGVAEGAGALASNRVKLRASRCAAVASPHRDMSAKTPQPRYSRV